MGWSIANIDNTVKITPAIAQELFEAQQYEGEIWHDVEEVTYRDRLYFNEDHSEHMDYMSTQHIQSILKKHKAKGMITFGSLQGDNKGQFWGYEFDGKGGMKELKGKLQWM